MKELHNAWKNLHKRLYNRAEEIVEGFCTAENTWQTNASMFFTCIVSEKSDGNSRNDLILEFVLDLEG